MRRKYLIFVLSSHRTQQLTLLQSGGGYKEHAVIRNISSFLRIYLLSLSVSQNAVAKDNFNKTEVKKIKGQDMVQAVRPRPLDAKARVQFHAFAWGIYDDNGQWTVG